MPPLEEQQETPQQLSLNKPISETPGFSASATTNLYLSEWSSKYKFLHGADLMHPLGMLVDRLLDEEERITKITSLRFNQLMMTQMWINVSVEPCARDNDSMIGTLETSTGRTLYFSAAPTNITFEHAGVEPINPYATALLGQKYMQPMGSTNHVFQLNKITDREIFQEESPYMHAATWMDVINLAYREVRQQDAEQGAWFVGGVEQFEIPNPRELTSGTGILIIKELRAKRTKGGFYIRPVEIMLACAIKGPQSTGIYNFIGTNNPDLAFAHMVDAISKRDEML